jgi:hypothetical protein
MIVSVHVYDDGDVELTRHDTKPKFLDDLLFVNDEKALRKELLEYGQPEERIDEALKLLDTERCVCV